MKTRREAGRIGVLLLVAAVLSAQAMAAGEVTELRLFRADGWLHAAVRARDLLDERTRLTIDSGLPGTCIYLLRLEDKAGRLVTERYVELSLRFDLWEDRYLLDNGEGTLELPSLAAADSALSHLADCDILSLTELGADTEYRLSVQIAVRPLAPEDRQRLSRYVSRNSGGRGEEVAIDLSGIFGQILGEKSSSRRTVHRSSPLFRVADTPGAP